MLSLTRGFLWAECRGEHMHAIDGTIGRVGGVVVDTSDQHVTHVLLDEVHLWGQKWVAISISAVTGVDDGVRLSLTKGDVGDLPRADGRRREVTPTSHL